MKNKIANANEAPSAIGNAHHTALIFFKTSDKKNATGRMKINCLVNETSNALTPFPVAWNNEINKIPKAAGIKHKLIVLNAGAPTLTISENSAELLPKKLNKNSGQTQNNAVPTVIITRAIHKPHFKAEYKRFLFLAP